jgi:hypothetical protein
MLPAEQRLMDVVREFLNHLHFQVVVEARLEMLGLM